MTESSDRGIRFDNAGPVAGSVFQVGAAGTVNILLTGPASAAPREVPSAVPFFTDRAGVMVALDRLCDDTEHAGPRVAVLTGPRGVGKSAVVRRWANSRADRYPDGQIYVDLGGISSAAVTAADVAAVVLARLGVPRQEIDGVLDGRIERFRTAVAGKRVLLVLDHAVTAAQVIPFVTSSADVVVTAASSVEALRLHGARFHEVGVLAEPFASALFQEIAGLDDLDEATEAVVAEMVHGFCGRLPLAIAMLGALYAGRRRRRGLAEWFDDICRSNHPLSRIRIEGEAPLQEILDETYGVLDPVEARVYRGVGVLPAGRFAAGHIAAMLAMTEEAASDALFELVDKCILTEDSGLFEVHGLIRWHARDVAEAYVGEEAADEIRCRVVDYMTACAQSMDKALVHTRLRVAAMDSFPEIAALADPVAANRWFDAQYPTALGYMRLARDCGQWRQVCAMSEAWWAPAYARHLHDFALELSDLGIEVAESLADPAISARLLGQSALVCIAAGSLEEASDRLDRAYRWLAAIGGDRVRLELAASLLEWSGKLFADKGDHGEAEAAFVQSRDYFRALESARGEAIQNYHLAKLAAKRKRHAEAARLVADALRQLDPHRDSLTVGRFAIFRARCLIEADEPLSARAELTALCALPAFSGAPFLLGQMHECISVAAEMLGDRVGARDALSAAYAAFERCGSDRASGIARRLAEVADP
ncbi:NB-ARC domain-containing protein [Mycobacterium sp. BMJ-28]